MGGLIIGGAILLFTFVVLEIVVSIAKRAIHNRYRPRYDPEAVAANDLAQDLNSVLTMTTPTGQTTVTTSVVYGPTVSTAQYTYPSTYAPKRRKSKNTKWKTFMEAPAELALHPSQILPEPPEALGLLGAIRDNPADMAPVMAYMDWVQERETGSQTEIERARLGLFRAGYIRRHKTKGEMIRTHTKTERFTPQEAKYLSDNWEKFCPRLMILCGLGNTTVQAKINGRFLDLRIRSRAKGSKYFRVKLEFSAGLVIRAHYWDQPTHFSRLAPEVFRDNPSARHCCGDPIFLVSALDAGGIVDAWVEDDERDLKDVFERIRQTSGNMVAYSAVSRAQPLSDTAFDRITGHEITIRKGNRMIEMKAFCHLEAAPAAGLRRTKINETLLERAKVAHEAALTSVAVDRGTEPA